MKTFLMFTQVSDVRLNAKREWETGETVMRVAVPVSKIELMRDLLPTDRAPRNAHTFIVLANEGPVFAVEILEYLLIGTES